MKVGLVISASLALVLFAGSASAADPIVIDTVGTFDTFVRPYTTNAKPPTWVPEVKVILAVDQWAAEDVLVLQLKKGKKNVGDAQTCSYYEYREAPPGALTGVAEKKDLVFFKCMMDQEQGVEDGGNYQLELSYKQPLVGNEVKGFATLEINVIKALHGNHNDPYAHFVENLDDRLNTTLVYESLVKEYGGSKAYELLKSTIERATSTGPQPCIPAKVSIRTWFKEGEKSLPTTTMTCLKDGKKVGDSDGDYPAESYDYWSFKKKGKEDRIDAKWIQKKYTIKDLNFDPGCGWEKFDSSNQNYDRYWLSKNPGEYKCVIMGGGDVLKEVYFTIDEMGKLVKPPCQSKINTVRHVALATVKDHKIANVDFDKKLFKSMFHRVFWDKGCPPTK